MKKELLIFSVLALILFMSNASAWGVSSHYTEGNPVVIYPGKSEVVSFVLQNMVESGDIKVKAIITSGSEYASIIGPSEYLVPLGNNNVEVKLNVTAPETEGRYGVTINFETIPGSGQGVMIGSSIDKRFNLLSSKGAPPIIPPVEPTQPTTIWPWIIAIIVVVAVVLVILLTRKKGKKKK